MIKVVLDTNGLLMPFQFSLNLDDEIQRLVGDARVYVPSSVIDELKGLDEKASLELAKKYREIEVEKSGDEGVLEAAKKLDGMIVTNDKELKKRAVKERIPIAYLRSKTHLEMIGEDWILSGREEETELEGKIVSGVNEGQYFLALEGYKKRFQDRFDFEPFEGTLNVKLNEGSLKRYEDLKDEQGVTIESFEEKGEHFGRVECFPCELVSGDKRLDKNTFLIIPKKSRYDEIVEIVSEFELREELELDDEDEIKVFVEPPGD